MYPFPETHPLLRTSRLLLRAMSEPDVPGLFAIYGDPEVMRFASDDAFAEPATVHVVLRSVAQKFAERSALERAIVRVADEELLGTCGLHAFAVDAGSAELGCLLARAHWGRGYMREALSAVIDLASQTLRLTRLQADIDVANERCLRLFKRLGFTQTGGTMHERELRWTAPESSAECG